MALEVRKQQENWQDNEAKKTDQLLSEYFWDACLMIEILSRLKINKGIQSQKRGFEVRVIR